MKVIPGPNISVNLSPMKFIAIWTKNAKSMCWGTIGVDSDQVHDTISKKRYSYPIPFLINYFYD